jgi:DNA-binding GntR family transcriptional regulator
MKPASKINKTGKQPLYQQLKEAIIEKLKDMSPLSPIPSERELCTMFGVSRPTVRRALKELEQENELYRLAGKGTFISDKNKYIDHELQWFIGFYEDASMQQKKPSSKVLQQIVAPASAEVSQKLGIPVDSEVMVLERLRFVDDEPICLVTSYIPLHICPDLLKANFSDQSLYKFLKSYNISIFKAKRSIEVKHATMSEAAYLDIENSPIVLFQSLGYTEDGVPFDYVKSRYPAYKARFESEVYQPKLEDN